MAEEPDRLKQDIENTRASLTRDVDLLAEKTSPKKVAQRRWTSVKEKVMGSTDTRPARRERRRGHRAGQGLVRDGHGAGQGVAAGDRPATRRSDAADAVRSAPRAVAQQTQGNPLAAGIIAFGVGMLAATLIPVTDAETPRRPAAQGPQRRPHRQGQGRRDEMQGRPVRHRAAGRRPGQGDRAGRRADHQAAGPVVRAGRHGPDEAGGASNAS